MRTKTIPPEVLTQLLSEETVARFWSHVDIGLKAECWPYRGFPSAGYPRFTIKFKGRTISFTAHKAAWTIHNKRDVPPGLFVLHKCELGITACCNPSHLKPGDQFENMADMKRLGRQNYVRGEKQPGSKLNQRKVVQIIALYKDRTQSVAKIAERFGVDPTMVSKIARGKSWRHVTSGLIEGISLRESVGQNPSLSALLGREQRALLRQNNSNARQR